MDSEEYDEMQGGLVRWRWSERLSPQPPFPAGFLSFQAGGWLVVVATPAYCQCVSVSKHCHRGSVLSDHGAAGGEPEPGYLLARALAGLTSVRLLLTQALVIQCYSAPHHINTISCTT